jgi:cell wall-associated NlpC family hydrolase
MCLRSRTLDRILCELNRIDQKVNTIMATLTEALEGWKSYPAELITQRDAAVAALTDAQTAAQTAADALAAFQADDAATDAQQLADQAQADADAVQAALDAVKTPPVAPPVVGEPVEPVDE